ncbi:transferase family protein [Stagonosporopsis vannaccii]|nr:transferase family protein [Stagonosporopsis vannaccii]
MTATASSMELHIARNSRVFPQYPATRERVVPLSLLDATTAKFGLTSAVWLIEHPSIPLQSTQLVQHLRTALGTTLNAYPQWCGFLKAVFAIDGENLQPETTSFPEHAKRYGRVYVQYGSNTDPGVEFTEATSSTTVDCLYNANSAKRRPIWNRREDEETLSQFAPPTNIVHALESNEKDTNGRYKPIMAVQCTELACGGLVLAAKIAHPLADITALARFVRDWACVSRAMLKGDALPVLNPVFEPLRIDANAAGDIEAPDVDPIIMEIARSLPLHRYDWWAPPSAPPSPFPIDLPLAGAPLPWAEWDTKAPVDIYTIHFTRAQIDHLWQSAIRDMPHTPSASKISKHDALLAHIWSCIVRARGLSDDPGPVHCDLTLGLRPAFQLDDSFVGSPIMLLNIEMAASRAASGSALAEIAQRIRQTISTINDSQRLASHLHSIAYEKAPQRIWQAFLGQRHILVTTWARAGMYDIDFGFSSRIRYADGFVPGLDGCILIVDGPPTESSNVVSQGWTDNGVDVTLPLRCEHMERLLRDHLLLPQVDCEP